MEAGVCSGMQTDYQPDTHHGEGGPVARGLLYLRPGTVSFWVTSASPGPLMGAGAAGTCAVSHYLAQKPWHPAKPRAEEGSPNPHCPWSEPAGHAEGTAGRNVQGALGRRSLCRALQGGRTGCWRAPLWAGTQPHGPLQNPANQLLPHGLPPAHL